TVPNAMERPPKVMGLKNVRGHLLNKEESHIEAFEEDSMDDQPNAEDDVALYSLKSSSRHVKHEITENVQDALSPDNSLALQRNVKVWCDATGLPTTITIHFQDRVFHLHKFPLVSRSGYLKRALKEAKEITLPSDVPGGPAVFELLCNFCYGSTILMEPSNIAELCCIANYLQMTEDYGRANLCQRSELYLTQVALQSWEDTLVVLQHCVGLAPHAEQLGIARRCLDALAFMACMELLDPVARKLPIPGRKGDYQTSYVHWWIQDLVAVPPSLFVNLILALRREGMQENYVGQVITAFADRWIVGLQGAVDSTVSAHKGSAKKSWFKEPPTTNLEPSVLIESVVGLLPLERNVVPMGFLFTLLRRGLSCALNDSCRIQLETRIALQFENATLQDVLIPVKKEKESGYIFMSELGSMERILKLFLTRFRGLEEVKSTHMAMLSATAKLWDGYLAEVAFHTSLTPGRFGELVERIPPYMRPEHDHVYKAIHSYIKAHPCTTQEERLAICRTLNCEKLSQKACSHAVQNDLMPLRMIVQAMIVQQLQTRSVLNSHLEAAAHSFRDHPCGFSTHGHSHRPSPPDPVPMCLSAGSSGRRHPYDYSQDSFRSLGSSVRDKDLYIDEAISSSSSQNATVGELSSSGAPKVDYQVTESRLRTLEAELTRMRKTLKSQANAAEENQNDPLRQTSSSHQSKVSPNKSVSEKAHICRSGQLNMPKRAAVHEGGVAMANCSTTAGGCMSHLTPMNRTTGLFGKTFQKLKLRTSGKTSGGHAAKENTAPIADKLVSVGRPAKSPITPDTLPRFTPDVGRYSCGRTDSMPRTTASRTKPHHVRHSSMS
uniref:NPH3 domain-containing protein n=3 Tax=Physcomitrium patens TaxID=3218 RepID=A0A7I4C706_PHYPA